MRSARSNINLDQPARRVFEEAGCFLAANSTAAVIVAAAAQRFGAIGFHALMLICQHDSAKRRWTSTQNGRRTNWTFPNNRRASLVSRDHAGFPNHRAIPRL